MIGFLPLYDGQRNTNIFKGKCNKVIFTCTKLGHHKKDSDLYVEATS